MNIDQRGDAITAGDGTTIRYRTFGNGGPAVVLLHGGMQPSLKFGTFSPIAWLPRYERELARGRKAAVFVTVMKGTADAPALRWVPHAVLVPLVKVGIRADGRASEVGG